MGTRRASETASSALTTAASPALVPVDGNRELRFFDTYNCPAWDTWVAFEEGDRSSSFGARLISWIPPALVGLVEAGTHVNPEECIQWLDADALTAWLR